MTSQQKYLALEAYVKTKIPGFEVRLKRKKYAGDPWYRPIADSVARVITPTYDTEFATTMYPYIYVPEGWIGHWAQMYGTLRHEYIHLRDIQKYGFLFKASYLAVLPSVFTARAEWEYRGFAQNIIGDVEREGKVPQERITRLLEHFTGRNYLFMDPFFAKNRIATLVKKAESGEIQGLWPYDEGFQTV